MAGTDRMKEEIIVLDQFSAVGILTHGTPGRDLPLIILYNAGLVHRPAQGRLHVKLARELASAGYFVFRFDYDGQGDSLARTVRPGEQRGDYMKGVLNSLEKKTNCERFVLAGICAGAEDAYTTGLADARVAGVVMINGTGLEEATYDALNPESKRRFQARHGKMEAHDAGPTGNTDMVCITDPFKKLRDNQVSLLLILSEGSQMYDLVCLAYERNDTGMPAHIFMKGVDHIISPIWAQRELINTIKEWCDGLYK